MATPVKTLGGSCTVKIDAAPDVVILGQQNATLNISADLIEVTTKSAISNKEFVPGWREWNIDFDGILMTAGDGSAADHIKDYWETGTAAAIVFYCSAGDTYTGNALFESIDLEAPQDKEARYKIKLKGAGALTIAAAA
jgi:predicted secreted protein